ncbi:MAG TPA: ATP-dependent RNA helicase HrpA [Gammaproteobacteria bacterium]
MSVPADSQLLQQLSAQLEQCLVADRRRLHGQAAAIRRRLDQGKPVDRAVATLQRELQAAQRRYQQRAALRPHPDYPEELPVSGRRAEIAAAIAAHQVVVVAGETGSGKTTQLPKICLELGRGISGLIGHTQPRRIAARSVARRIAEELKSSLGAIVGYKVRFTDQVSEQSLVKVMTDGILLAEIQSDALLGQYDTLIIDEAHERSLNIDFLLGYLKQLLPRRPDRKLVITSASINTEAGSIFFDEAPVLEVSGRTYPVEVRYRPVQGDDEETRDRDLPQAVVDAVDELGRLDPLGDTLIFLPGEREIREVSEALRKHPLRHTEIVPLFSRLSTAEQDKVFQPHGGRRLVLATNVAETSLTVPGIRFVIDTGSARISRYSPRTKVQRLPIEPVSQASANQRAGRCGRVSAGVCIRLYSEEDYLARPLFTDPEILRTNLASVILQMSVMNLGEVEAFPFLAAPDKRDINDGFALLHELGAVDELHELTTIGRQLARLPLDPRIGRMLLAAERERALHEVLIIAAALTIQEPRERPMDAQQAADAAHARFHDERSDFLAYLRLGDHFHEQARHLSNSKLRKQCRDEFLSYVRLREWHEIHGQLAAVCGELGFRINEEPADYNAIHRALLTGLIGNIAFKQELDKEKTKEKGRERSEPYLGARGNKLAIFPGSGLAKKPPKWLVAAEVVETSRLFARITAAIDPLWLESLAAHLLRRHYFEPHWEKNAAQVAAFEQVTLYGLTLIAKRRVNYGPIDPTLSRELFIRHALVGGDYRSEAPCLKHNRALLEEVEQLEAKSRRRDLLVDEQTLFAFYDAKLPPHIYSGKSFEKWRREAERDHPRLLFMSRDDLLQREALGLGGELFPDLLRVNDLQLPLHYHFEPGASDDGVTVLVPLAALGQLTPEPFEWLVPGMLRDKLTALIRALPKSLRVNFVPAPNFAEAALEGMPFAQGALFEQLSQRLLRITGTRVPLEMWRDCELPGHLQMNFRVLGDDGQVWGEGRDLLELQQRLAGKVRATLAAAPAPGIEREQLTRWDFGALPEQVEIRPQGIAVKAWPALVDQGDSVAINLFESAGAAAQQSRAGLRRLFMLANADKMKYLRGHLPDLQSMCLRYVGIGSCDQLRDDLITAAVDRALALDTGVLPRTAEDFEARATQARQNLIDEANALCAGVAETLQLHHDIRKVMKGSVMPAWLPALADVAEQLEQLLYQGCVVATPAQWLDHYPRYLRAITLRLEKLRQSPERDRKLMLEVTPHWQRVVERLKAGQPLPEPLQHYRWMVEELRVSLYAQELKTIAPASPQRLEKLWQEIKNL